jgi:2'-5' RNA ligase
MATRRLFFALWLPEAVAAALHRHALDLVGSGPGRVMRADTLHLTLAFLGDVDETRLPELLSLGARVATGRTRFPLTIDRSGHWSHNRIDWAGCAIVPDALAGLVGELRAGLSAAGFQVEDRSFVPHVTLVRKRAGTPFPSEIDVPSFEVDALRLVESKRGPDGANYMTIGRWPLT